MTQQRSRRSERGGATTGVLVALVPVLLICMGLVVDGTTQRRATQDAQGTARDVVRVAMDARADHAVGAPGPRNVVEAAKSHMALHDIDGSVELVDGELEVQITSRAPTVFLSLIGVESLPVRGSASAHVDPTRN